MSGKEIEIETEGNFIILIVCEFFNTIDIVPVD